MFDIQTNTGEDVYNMLMAQIEPELTTDVLPTLDQKYATETPEEKEVRYARYADAYARYDVAYAQWATALRHDVDALRRDALRSTEHEDRNIEANTLSSMDTQIASL